MRIAYRNCLCLLAIVLGVGTPLTAQAQTLPATEAPQAVENVSAQSPLCDPDLIDGTFTFANLPAGEQTISLHFQNKGNASCRLEGQLGASFAVDSHSMHVATCWLCKQNDAPSYGPEPQPRNQIVLAPGERAAVDLHWQSTGNSCQWADWVTFGGTWAKPIGYLVIPSEWPMHICSVVKSVGYHAEENTPSTGEVRDGMLRVSFTPAIVYSDEYATLHVELTSQKPAEATSAGCASLYTVRQVPGMGTRFDPLPVTGPSSRPSYTPEQIQEDKERAWPSWKKDHLRRCDIPDGRTTADAEIRAAEFANIKHVEWRPAAIHGEVPIFLSAATHFSVLDPETLEPNWGDPVQGIRAGLSIDRARFRLGEWIPIHLRWENAGASTPLAQGECREPLPSLEIQDSQHNVVKTIPIVPMCMGHGWGPFMVPKGEAQRTFIELATTRPTEIFRTNEFWTDLLRPGVYYLVSVWTPSVLDTSGPGPYPDSPHVGVAGRVGKAYATTRSLPVRIEITPSDNP